MERVCKKDGGKIFSINFYSFFMEDEVEIPIKEGLELISEYGGQFDYERKNSV